MEQMKLIRKRIWLKGAVLSYPQKIDAEPVVVVDSSKIVDRLGSSFPVPVEVITTSHASDRETGRQTRTTNGCQKAGPVITDQGNGYWCKMTLLMIWPRKTE